MSLFKEVADIQTAEMLKLPVPKANYHNIAVKPSEMQKEMVEELSNRAEQIRNKMVDESTDNMLKITNDGRKLALDQRLINNMLDDFKSSKVATCAENIYKIWEENKNEKLTQLVFCDLSTPKALGNEENPFVMENVNGVWNLKEHQFTDVYTDLKRKLIQKGVPAEDIEFIHNADSETKKKELFTKVRKGEIRILMGSTLKMGAGTNVQDKLIALHDLDCPWRPSDLTQRSGRIIRQGNQNSEVNIYRYVTEGTFDAYLYQLVENKQRFISQIMTSKSPVRSAEDIDEASLSYAEIKALAAGNPLIIEKTELDIAVSKLKLLKQSYLSEIYDIQSKVIKYYPNEINRLENRIKGLQDDIEHSKEYTKLNSDKFSPMTINDTIYTEKTEAGKEILNLCKNMKSPAPISIGNYRGFNMELYFDTVARDFKISLKNNLSHTVALGEDVYGNITRLDNVIDGIEKQLDKSKELLEDTKQQYENAKQECNKTFPQEKELNEKSKRLEELNVLLNMNEKTSEILDCDDIEKEVSQDYEKEPSR